VTNIQEFSAFLASRRTTRDFLPTPIEPRVIAELITDGLTAPSWSNTRPYMVAIATGEVRDRISADMMRRAVLLTGFRVGSLADKIKFLFTPKAWPISDHSMLAPYPVELQPRARKVGKELYGLIGVPRGDKQAREKQWMKNYEFFGAPVELFIFAHKDLGVHAANDAGLFSQNLMLSAHARGLGTCAQGAAVLWADAIRREFNVPKGYKLLYGIAIGHPAESLINTFGADRISAAEITVPLVRG
jgi:nitroreductase